MRAAVVLGRGRSETVLGAIFKEASDNLKKGPANEQRYFCRVQDTGRLCNKCLCGMLAESVIGRTRDEDMMNGFHCIAQPLAKILPGPT